MSEKLFNCPDCNKEVSKTAKVCPHCGNKKLKKQIAEKNWAEMDPKKKKMIYIGAGAFVVLWIVVSVFGGSDKPDACNCYDVLNIPTTRMGNQMPLPVEHLGNEKFREYKECYEEYPGPATALIECGKK